MKYVIVLLALSLAVSAQAAKPTSVKYVEDITTDANEVYMHYIVNCADGKVADLSAWNNQRFWCTGTIKKDPYCFRKETTAAKKACKSTG